jgi:hypothetical protein
MSETILSFVDDMRQIAMNSSFFDEGQGAFTRRTRENRRKILTGLNPRMNKSILRLCA